MGGELIPPRGGVAPYPRLTKRRAYFRGAIVLFGRIRRLFCLLLCAHLLSDLPTETFQSAGFSVLLPAFLLQFVHRDIDPVEKEVLRQLFPHIFYETIRQIHYVNRQQHFTKRLFGLRKFLQSFLALAESRRDVFL